MELRLYTKNFRLIIHQKHTGNIQKKTLFNPDQLSKRFADRLENDLKIRSLALNRLYKYHSLISSKRTNCSPHHPLSIQRRISRSGGGGELFLVGGGVVEADDRLTADADPNHGLHAFVRCFSLIHFS